MAVPRLPTSVRPFLIWALLLIPVALGGWFALGPFFISRSVHFTLSAKAAGPKWSFEWLDKKRDPINGIWLAAVPDKAGNVNLECHKSVASYRFDYMALRWWDAPGTTLIAPTILVRERIFGITFERTLRSADTHIPGTASGAEGFSSANASGGAVFVFPHWTAAQFLDLAFVYLILLAFVGVGCFWHAVGGDSRWYRPGGAALILVGAVHVWLAIRMPMMFCPDSMEYAVEAHRFIEHPSFEYFGGMRPPGYAFFQVPFQWSMVHYAVGLVWAQAALAVGTAWLASRITRVFLSANWGALVLVVVGLDPVLIMWSHYAMSESLCAFVATLLAWGALQPRMWTSTRLNIAILGAIGLGVVAAMACYIRGNYQVMALILPLAVGAWAFFDGQRRRGIVLALVMFATTGVCVAPWMIHNYRAHGKFAMIIGSGFTQMVGLSSTAVLDQNQSTVLTYDQWRDLAINPDPNGLQITSKLQAMKGVPLADRVTTGDDWTTFDARAAVVSRETVSRHPAQRWDQCLRSLGNLLGVYSWPVSRENEYWSRALRYPLPEQPTNHPLKPEQYLEAADAAHIKDIYDRTNRELKPWVSSATASAFDSLYSFSVAVRPLWGGLFLVGLMGAIKRGQWPLLLVGLVPLAHACAVSMILLMGIDRYQAPLFPLMSILACYGLAGLAGVLRRGADSGPVSGLEKADPQGGKGL